MTYSVTATPRVEREVAGLPAEVRKSVYAAFALLRENPRPPGAKKLQGDLARYYRLRVEDHRMAYSVDDRTRTVTVWHIGDRNHFYEEVRRLRG